MYALTVDEDWLVVVVADGVSEGTHSQVTAETAARAACKLVLEQLAGEQPVDWVWVCGTPSRRIIEEARYRRLAELEWLTEDRDQVKAVRRVMSTTAVLAALRRTPRSPVATSVC